MMIPIVGPPKPDEGVSPEPCIQVVVGKDIRIVGMWPGLIEAMALLILEYDFTTDRFAELVSIFREMRRDNGESSVRRLKEFLDSIDKFSFFFEYPGASYENRVVSGREMFDLYASLSAGYLNSKRENGKISYSEYDTASVSLGYFELTP